MSRRAAVLLPLVLLAAALAASVAHAGPLVDRAVAALREDPIFVHPDAERAIPPSDAERLRSRIREADAGPIYVAILPNAVRDEAGGDTSAVLGLVVRRLGRRGTYAVVAGNQFRAAGTDFPVRALADDAFRARGRDGVTATLLDFVDRVASARSAQAAEPAGGGGEDQSSGGLGLLGILGAIAAGAIGLQAGRRPPSWTFARGSPRSPRRSPNPSRGWRSFSRTTGSARFRLNTTS